MTNEYIRECEIGARSYARVVLCRNVLDGKHYAMKVRVNDRGQEPPFFTTGIIGKDNSIARHGIHGLYWLYSVQMPSEKLLQGDSINLGVSPWRGILYDYIRLESPPYFAQNQIH